MRQEKWIFSIWKDPWYFLRLADYCNFHKKKEITVAELSWALLSRAIHEHSWRLFSKDLSGSKMKMFLHHMMDFGASLALIKKEESRSGRPK